MPSEIEKMIKKEISEKKKISQGVKHRASRKKGFKGKVKTPVDFMSRKEKTKYTKGSSIVSYNIFDKIVTYEEFKLFDDNMKKGLLDEYLYDFSISEIAKAWNVNVRFVYELIHRLNIDLYSIKERKDKRMSNTPNEIPVVENYEEFKKLDSATKKEVLKRHLRQFDTRKEAAEAWNCKPHNLANFIYKLDIADELAESDKQKATQEEYRHDFTDLIPEGFTINFKGNYKGKKIKDTLELSSKFLGENTNYEIILYIKENENSEEDARFEIHTEDNSIEKIK